jgi:hydrogenase-4 component B
MNLFFYSIFLYLAGGIAQGFVPVRFKNRVFGVFSALASALLVFLSLQVVLSGHTISTTLSFHFPFGNIPFTIDALSGFFILVIAIVGFIAILYSCGYLKAYRSNSSHLFFLSVLIVFMLLVTVLQNALAFLIAWEIMSLASFFLVAFENEKKEVFDAAIHYLVAMHVGVVFLISAFLLLYIKTGSLEFSAFPAFFKTGGALVGLLFIFFFIGFGTKAGFIPFHVWLPKAHPAAPAHISGIMSAVMIKTGIYGILRILTLMGTPSRELSYFTLGIALVSALLGIIYASAQRDIKRFLAYSSIENIGIIGIGMGIGMLGLSYQNPEMAALGFAGSLFHLFNHSIFKALLFFGVGAVYQKTHSRDMEKMGGLIHTMPYTAFFTLAGSVAICALPPFNGFIGEFILYLSMLKGIMAPNALVKTASIISIGSMAFVGAIAMIAFTKMFSVVFLGAPRVKHHEDDVNKDPKKEAAPIMLVIMGFLALEALVIGLFPHIIFRLVEQPLHILGAGDGIFIIPYIGILSKISSALCIFFLLFLLFYGLRRFLLKNKPVTYHSTWGCGYQAPSPRMQYTGSSYVRSFLLLMRPILNIRFYITSPGSLFPSRWKLKTHFPDFFDVYIISPISKSIRSSVKLFSWIQRGSTQQYILYGLLFLAIAIIWILGTS